MKLDGKEVCAEYGRRVRKGVRIHQYMIEGEYVTMKQISERLGITIDSARMRVHHARKKKEPTTWKMLSSVVSSKNTKSKPSSTNEKTSSY